MAFKFLTPDLNNPFFVLEVVLSDAGLTHKVVGSFPTISDAEEYMEKHPTECTLVEVISKKEVVTVSKFVRPLDKT